MRVNVYNEEVRDRVRLLKRNPKNAPTVTFRGIEFLVGDPEEHTPGDDDSSAVIFWYSLPRTVDLLRSAFMQALKMLEENPPE